MRNKIQRLVTHGGVGARVVIAACIIALTAVGVMAATPNEIYNSEMVDQNQAAPPKEESAPEGFWSPTVISSADFRSDGFNMTDFYFYFAGGYLMGDDSEGHCFMAPVYAPNGATINSFNVSGVDNHASDITVTLARVGNYDGLVSTMGSASSTGATTTVFNIADSSIIDAVIDQPNYSYYMTACLSNSDHKLYSARIYWTR